MLPCVTPASRGLGVGQVGGFRTRLLETSFFMSLVLKCFVGVPDPDSLSE